MARQRHINYSGENVVEVTDVDINGAVPKDPSNCAIARAVQRVYPEAKYINVGRGTIAFTDKKRRVRVKLRTSLKAMDAQEKLDRGQRVKPEDFPPIRLRLDEAKIEPVRFTDEERLRQNKRRREIAAGKRTVKPMSEREKAKRRDKRRHA